METDQQVFERVKCHCNGGQDNARAIPRLLADNRTFEPYWQDGWDAIEANTVEQFVFGRDVMIAVGRLHSIPQELVESLAFELDRAAARHAKGLTPPSPYKPAPKAPPGAFLHFPFAFHTRWSNRTTQQLVLPFRLHAHSPFSNCEYEQNISTKTKLNLHR